MTERAIGKELESMTTVRLFNPENPSDFSAAKRIDQTSLYAESPFGEGEDLHKPMSDDELKDWLKGDESHIVYAICRGDEPVGYAYFYRGDEDTVDRESKIRDLAQSKGISLGKSIWEVNFDIPGEEGSNYFSGCQNGLKEAIGIFAQTQRESSSLVFLVEGSDRSTDGRIIELDGGRHVGRLKYPNAGSELGDHIFHLNLKKK